MPNGYDRLFVELKMACASYRFSFGEWPSRLEIHPRVLWYLASLFDSSEEFGCLAERLEIRTHWPSLPDERNRPWVVLSGDAGTADDLFPPEIDSPEVRKRWAELVGEAEEWLGVQIREPREGEYY